MKSWLTPHWKRTKIWDVTIRVSRYLDKVFKKLGPRVNLAHI